MDELLAEREKTHGRYRDVAFIAEETVNLWATSKNWNTLPAYHKFALRMIAGKVARWLCGDEYCLDHCTDVAGYATLVVKELEAHGKKDPG